MNRYVKILSKILANKSNNTLKGSYTMNKWDIQGYKDFSVSINQSIQTPYQQIKNKNHTITSTDVEQATDEI